MVVEVGVAGKTMRSVASAAKISQQGSIDMGGLTRSSLCQDVVNRSRVTSVDRCTEAETCHEVVYSSRASRLEDVETYQMI